MSAAGSTGGLEEGRGGWKCGKDRRGCGEGGAVVRVGGRWNYMYMQRGGKDAKSDVISVHFNDESHKSYPALGMGIASLVSCSRKATPSH